MSLLKVELHAHTDADPLDGILHSAKALVDRAATLGYGALAITLHNRYTGGGEIEAYARSSGIVLIPGIERSIAHRHVLLLNFPPDCADVRTYPDIAALKRRTTSGLVVAPHSFYPIASALRGELDRHADLFDAVEVNAMYTRLVNFNARAIRWAREHGKPLVGNTDLHLLGQMGTTFSLVEARPDADAICEAIRAGRVEVKTQPLSTVRAGWYFGSILATGVAGRIKHLRSGPRTPESGPRP